MHLSRWRSSWSAQTCALGNGSKSSGKLRKDRKVNGNSQHRFITGKSCLTSLISSCNEMTGSVDEGRAVGFTFPDFIKTAITASPCRTRLTLRRTSKYAENGSTETARSSNGKFYTWYKITSWTCTGWALTTWTAAPEKDLGHLEADKLDRSQQCALTVTTASCVGDCTSKSRGSRSKKSIILLYLALVRAHLEHWPQSTGLPCRRQILTNWRDSDCPNRNN